MSEQERLERLDKILTQLTEGNGAETETTRGLTLREIVLEMRHDFNEHRYQEVHPGAARRGEVYGVVAAAMTIFAGYLTFFA